MTSMTVDKISRYRLREDDLLEYLRSVFPGHGNFITAESADDSVYTLRIPRALSQAERVHIIGNLREYEEVDDPLLEHKTQSGTAIDEQAPYSTAETPPPSHGRILDSGPIDDFAEFVHRKRQEHKGRDGTGEEKDYVPSDELSAYWTINRIRDACESCSEGIDTSHDLIRERYLRVFSTLVYTGQLCYLPAFQRHELWDEKFPSTTLPGVWKHLPSYGDMFINFMAYQWTFFPVILDRDYLDDASLPSERILPVSVQATLRKQLHSDKAAITYVKFHSSCNILVKTDGNSATTPSYILKTYHGKHLEQRYQHEMRAFKEPHEAENIIQCHATFKHGETYNLVLGWVAKGTLLRYFQSTSPPQISEDTIDFWDSLLKLKISMDRMHQIVSHGERSNQDELGHQDIKPDDVLLDVPMGSKPNELSPIITDTGHSPMRHVEPNSSDIPAVDRRGSQRYPAPEKSRQSGYRRSSSDGAKWDTDVFSASAVFSESSSWVAKGQDGRKEYFRHCQREVRNKLMLLVLDIIEDHMWVLPKGRLQARLLHSEFEKEILDAKAELLGGLPGREQSQHPSSLDYSMLQNFLPETGSVLSMQDVPNWRKAMKLDGQVDSSVKKAIDKLVGNLARRDLIFFIDDTESMEEHSVNIQLAFQTLAYIAKSIDPGELELSFVSNPLDIFKSRKTSMLLEELRQHLSKHVSVKGMIESSLDDLINQKIMKRLPYSVPLLGQVPAWYKPITVFVFTDGKWGEEVQVGNGLTAPIGKLMQEMKKRAINRTHVIFQFLQFGNDEKGREHLDYLYDFGKEEDWDIVDTRDISGDVYSMFLAALTRDNDIKEEHETADPPAHNAIIADPQPAVSLERRSEVGELELVIPKDKFSKDDVLVEDGHSYEGQDKEMSAEAPSVERLSDLHSNPALESLQGSSLSASSLQHELSAPYLQSLSGTHSKQSTALSTSFRGSSLDRVNRGPDTPPDIIDLCQPRPWSNEASDDIDSIASIPGSIDSTASTSHPLGQVGVNYIVSKFTQCDPELLTLYTEASQKLTQSRFVDNNRRLLKLFYLELAGEVQTTPQAEAASFLKSRRRRSAISSEIFQRMIPDDGESRMPPEKEFSRLDEYFNTLKPTEDPQATDSSDGDSEVGLDPQELFAGASILQATGNFLVESQAFASYKQRLQSFIRPSHGKKQPTARPHGVSTTDPQLSNLHGKTGKIGESETTHLEEEVSKAGATVNDEHESQDKAISAELPPVEEESDPTPDATLEHLWERFPSTSQEVDLDLSAATLPISTRISKWVTDRLWPPRAGSQRIWYLCGCGRHTYIDVEEHEPGGALESVRQSIIESAAAVRGRPTLPQHGRLNTREPNLATPSPVYSGMTYSRGAPVTPSRMTAPNLAGLPTGFAIPATVPTPDEPQTMHLLVCISGREYETLPKVRHLEVTDKWDDGMLLRGLLREYEQARQGRQWSVSLLLPALPSNFEHSSLVKFLRKIHIPYFIRDSSLLVWEWWFRWAPDGGLWAPLYLPSTADFVKFQVVSQAATQEPYPDQFQCGQWPSSSDPWPYSYKPLPMRLTTMNIPLWHELRYPGPHLGYQWFNAAAKKLDGRLFDAPLPNDCIPDIVGYGIRVNERLNDVLILWWSWVVILFTAVFVLVYIKWTGDHSSAFSLGAYLVAAFTVYIQLQYAWWRRS